MRLEKFLELRHHDAQVVRRDPHDELCADGFLAVVLDAPVLVFGLLVPPKGSDVHARVDIADVRPLEVRGDGGEERRQR